MTESAERKYGSRIYAGVLGKMIGVYLGRPVEGWPYERIKEEFGEVDYYVHEKLNLPLIVADDDLSGTFGFFRVMEDNPGREITSQEIGHTWLNYIIEEKSILWWGGLGRSTEHTAYLRLKSGIPAPESGSIQQNGRTMAEQIGAQIFIDAFAMMCPDDPEKAVHYVREAARVSHDGVAVDAACFLGALEALAFSERNIEALLDKALPFVSSPRLLRLIDDIRTICSARQSWREARAEIDGKYGYHRFPGPCPMMPNHALVLASLLLGGDDFHRSVTIASSAAGDTDCNAGNIGCLNGIRLGLDSLTEQTDLRTPVADRLLVVTADGGGCITDAVLETRRIINAAASLRGEPEPTAGKKRFAFDFPGSLQGFASCPYSEFPANSLRLSKPGESAVKPGLRVHLLHCSTQTPTEISTPTFIEQSQKIRHFPVLCSPTLYSGQKVEAWLTTEAEGFSATPYILYYSRDNAVKRAAGTPARLTGGENRLEFSVPDTGGMPIFRFGFRFSADGNHSGQVIIQSVDWSGAPREFAQRGVLMTSIWDIDPPWLQVWASSAAHFAPDFSSTYCISHPEDQGLVTQGTGDWDDYSLESHLLFSLHKKAGLVVRSRGHRRYYAALFSGGRELSLILRRDEEERVLSACPFPYDQDRPYKVKLTARLDRLSVEVEGKEVLTARDRTYRNGAAGYRIDTGTVLAENFIIRSCT